MRENPDRWTSEPGPPLSRRAILLDSVFGVLVAAAVFLAVQHFYGGGTEQDRAGLDVVRTAGTLVVGIGGFIALLLTARRQRSTELTLVHQREVAAATERDAAEQRITELYTRAVDQLGNDKAPVRLGGLHALERLAQNNSDQRQAIVDIICAYLRMPYTSPDDQPLTENAPANVHTRYENRRQELQVRLTAQRILSTHLRPEAGTAFWTGIDLNLTEAHLHELDLANCHIQKAQFGGAQFAGAASFGGAQFAGVASFGGAQFSGVASFRRAQLSDAASFREAQFSGHAAFDGAQFSGHAVFNGAQFSGDAQIDGAQFSEVVWFTRTQFSGLTMFNRAQFGGDAWFNETQFGGHAAFDGAQFSGDAWFDGARARPGRHHLWPAGWTTRDARAVDGEEEGWLYLVRDEDSSEQPTPWG